jgi:hypothetical protein
LLAAGFPDADERLSGHDDSGLGGDAVELAINDSDLGFGDDLANPFRGRGEAGGEVVGLRGQRELLSRRIRDNPPRSQTRLLAVERFPALSMQGMPPTNLNLVLLADLPRGGSFDPDLVALGRSHDQKRGRRRQQSREERDVAPSLGRTWEAIHGLFLSSLWCLTG